MIWAAILLLVLGAEAQVGPSGIVSRDGKNIQFPHDFAKNIVLIGPSGIVTKTGRNLQLTDKQVGVPTHIGHFIKKRSVGFVSPNGNVGTSGILRADGTVNLFDHDTAHSIVLIGPSGIVTKSGRNMQLTDKLHIVGRKKRSVGFVSTKGNVGTSGILRADGTTDLFDHDTAHSIVLIGPSGIVTKSGRNMQLTDKLNIVGRKKRALPLIGDSGIILEDGTLIQFKKAGAYIVANGPSGVILSDGTLVQKSG